MFNIRIPVRIHFGNKTAQKLPQLAEAYGKKVFLVAAPFLEEAAWLQSVIKEMRSAGKTVHTFYDIPPNPTAQLIDQVAALALAAESDLVVGIGGGSAIDTAKAVALLATNHGNSWDYTERKDEEVRRPHKDPLPLIAVPTTAGTGTEATPYSVISNPQIRQKCTIVNERVFPTISVVDPELMVTMTKELTALTGIDAFSHAFESYINVNASPFSKLVALEAIRLFAANIKTAVFQGGNLQARANMALCSTLAGIAIAHAGTTVPHALGQPLSGLTNAPHGGSIAACLAEVVAWTLPQGEQELATVAGILEPKLLDLPAPEQAAALPQILKDLFSQIGAAVSFGGYGLLEDQIEDFCHLVYNSFQIDLQGHPKQATHRDLVQLARSCL